MLLQCHTCNNNTIGILIVSSPVVPCSKDFKVGFVMKRRVDQPPPKFRNVPKGPWASVLIYYPYNNNVIFGYCFLMSVYHFQRYLPTPGVSCVVSLCLKVGLVPQRRGCFCPIFTFYTVVIGGDLQGPNDHLQSIDPKTINSRGTVSW